MKTDEAIKEVERRMHEAFPRLDVFIYPDETEDNIIVAIDNDFYYSDEYLACVLNINRDFLWRNKIFNFLFVKEKQYISDMAEEVVRDFVPFDTEAAEVYPVEKPSESAEFIIDSEIYFEAA
jgi:hypothetical protein